MLRNHVCFQIAFIGVLFLTNFTEPVAVGEMVFKFMLVSQVSVCEWFVAILEITHRQLPWVYCILIGLVAWKLWVLVLEVRSWFRFLILIFCLRVSILPWFCIILIFVLLVSDHLPLSSYHISQLEVVHCHRFYFEQIKFSEKLKDIIWQEIVCCKALVVDIEQ